MALTTWRLIIDEPGDGPWNMAVDESILENIIIEKSSPTLRLYAWSPPTLSLGYAQSISDVDTEKLNQLGWGLVRRPTGGRAILHTDELTYSVIAPADDPLVNGSVLESYRRLSTALINALRLLGIQATVKENETTRLIDQINPICFEVPSNYEIIFDGKKLIGSAQARRKSGVLQHGSLPISGNLSRITRVLNYAEEDSRIDSAQRLLQHATTVEKVLSTIIPWEDAAYAFEKGFSTTYDINLEPGLLTQEEISLAYKLVNEKHGNQEWISRI